MQDLSLCTTMVPDHHLGHMISVPQPPPPAVIVKSPAALPIAVEVSNVEFKYGKNYFDPSMIITNPMGFMNMRSSQVLKKISISAPKGKIYALLGASGCGKTTLLKCILGQLQPKSGYIKIFGQKPGSRLCPVPGPGVGYMPQELALFPELTVQETLRYFGQLYKMPTEKIQSRIEYIVDFLGLPGSNRRVKQLSGGQQRRVSLACALIHQPALMILDEPTVGVDPLLRVTIWKHLEELCIRDGLTVILTTHYIEEARAAETIGLMRNGQLLVQANPEVLLVQHNLSTLEQVFLKLAVKQDDEKKSGIELSALPPPPPPSSELVYYKSAEINNNFIPNTAIVNCKPPPPSEPYLHPIMGKRPAFFDFFRFYALLTKNCISLRRSILVTVFYCFLPALQFSLFMFCSGKSPSHIPVAVVNDEDPANMTGRFLDFMDPVAIVQVNTSTVEEATEVVMKGKAWAAMHLYGNFTSALDERRQKLILAEDDVVKASNIHLYLDMTNPVLGAFVISNVFLSFYKLMKEYLGKIGYNPNVLSAPMTIAEVVYGTMDLNAMTMTEFITPGLIILIAFFSTAAVAGLALILEQKDGLMKRSLVAGVQPLESLLAHVFTQTMVLIFQQVLLFLTIFFVFGVNSRGPLLIIFIICFLQGIAGTMYGLFISSLFPDEVSAAIVTMGSFLPTLMISGIMWPIKSISIYLHYISLFLPQTLAMHSIRSVLSRGWGLEKTEVWLGFWSSGAWATIYLLLAAFLFSRYL